MGEDSGDDVAVADELVDQLAALNLSDEKKGKGKGKRGALKSPKQKTIRRASVPSAFRKVQRPRRTMRFSREALSKTAIGKGVKAGPRVNSKVGRTTLRKSSLLAPKRVDKTTRRKRNKSREQDHLVFEDVDDSTGDEGWEPVQTSPCCKCKRGTDSFRDPDDDQSPGNGVGVVA